MESAMPSTYQKPNGLRKLNSEAAVRSVAQNLTARKAKAVATQAPASVAAPTRTASPGASIATSTATRTNDTAVARTAPGARTRADPSPEATRLALAIVTAVEEINPPAAAASSAPRRSPKSLTET